MLWVDGVKLKKKEAVSCSRWKERQRRSKLTRLSTKNKMAAILRKLLRSSGGKLDKYEKQGVGGGGGGGGGGNGIDTVMGSPGQATARRLLARACSTMQGYRDATKVSPAENNNVPLNNRKISKGVGGGMIVSGIGSGSSKPSSKKPNAAMAESTAIHAKLVRTRRLMREFQEMSKQQRECASPIFTVELADDNLYEWNVKLHRIDPESELYRDMRETNTPFVLLNLSFPDNFPFAPPFMRVITPHIEKGFVMEGGAICMELLTPSGWASAYTIEAIVMQFSASLVKGQGRIVRKVKGGKSFNKKAAEVSFRSLVKTHDKYGWVTPPLADG